MKYLEDKREKKLRRKNNLLKNFFLALILGLWFIGLFYYIKTSTYLEIPIEENKIIPYFEETGADLKYLYCSLLKRAKKSIFISTFGLSDPDILAILKTKKAEGVKITHHNSPAQKKLRKKISGLYHKKILIIDDKELYIGSANCSKPSLTFFGNQIFGFCDADLIQSVLNNSSFQTEDLSFFLLPKDKKEALSKLLNTLKEAKNHIYITMYALTHKEIIAEIISAYKRGVKIAIFLDKKMSEGTCKKYTTNLQKEGIPIYIRVKNGTLHHKSALIDDTYITGSANWSAAGFSKNEETLLFLNKSPPEVNNFIKSSFYFSTPTKGDH